MKTILHRVLFLMLLMMVSFSANAISIYPEGIGITPISPLVNEFIVADVYGYYATPGYTLTNAPTVSISGSDIAIDFAISGPRGIMAQVLEPFSYLIDIGTLSVGAYSITANFYVNNVFNGNVGANFTVNEVPTPSTIFLFLSGVLFIYKFTQKKA